MVRSSSYLVKQGLRKDWIYERINKRSHYFVLNRLRNMLRNLSHGNSSKQGFDALSTRDAVRYLQKCPERTQKGILFLVLRPVPVVMEDRRRSINSSRS